MTIPLDRLYHYIEHVASDVHENVLIYHFYPHGSKKLEDLIPLRNVNWFSMMTEPSVICHDQEPLNYDYFENYVSESDKVVQLQLKYDCYKSLNLKNINIFDQCVLLHSEKKSPEVEKYNNDKKFVTVYYWSHAVIALDWFRFARHIQQRKHVEKTFLIYNRAWSGTREYRIKFAEMLVNADLAQQCLSSVNIIEPELQIYYRDHNFENPQWRTDLILENHFPISNAKSSYSADFDIDDYERTHIEVVLETLFDDARWHLTEKTLRPIALGQPFILVSTPGSLEYLREYGFKTFDSIWDESYDHESNPQHRMAKIIHLMKQISTWDQNTRDSKIKQAMEIATFNQRHFFSQTFFDKIADELKNNLTPAVKHVIENNTGRGWVERRKLLYKHQELKDIITGRRPNPNFLNLPPGHKWTPSSGNTQQVIQVLKEAKKYYKNNQ